MVYYITCCWELETPATYVLRNDYILCFADRSTADYFFRTLQDLKRFCLAGGHVNFATLARAAPQYWTWGGDATNGDHLLHVVEGLSRMTADCGGTGQAFVPFQKKVHIVCQTHCQDPVTPMVIPNQTTHNVDWISGNTFFIKQVGYSDRYWYSNGDDVAVSNSRRSRFRITINDHAHQDPDAKYIIIDSDKVQIHSVYDNNNDLLGVYAYADDGKQLVRRYQPPMKDTLFLFSALKMNFRIDNGQYIHYTERGDNDVFECC